MDLEMTFNKLLNDAMCRKGRIQGIPDSNKIAEFITNWMEANSSTDIHNVSARFTVFSEIDGVFEQLSVCIYETKAEAECFADAMRDTVKYYDTEIVVLNVC